MKYIGANGVPGMGGTNFGSGLGTIPQSSLAGLGGMGNEISGTGALGSFGAMPQNFGVVGLGAENGADPAVVAAAAKMAADAAQQEALKKAEAKKSNAKKYLLLGGLAVGAYLLWKSKKPSRAFDVVG